MNRLGIILNLVGSLLIAPELIGLRRLSSFEKSLENRLINVQNNFEYIALRASRLRLNWLILVFYIIPLTLTCTGIIIAVINLEKIRNFFEQNISDNSFVTVTIIAILVLALLLGIWQFIPSLFLNIYIRILFIIISALFESVRFAIKVLSVNNALRKFIVRFGLILFIVGALLQLLATYQ